MYRIIDTKDPNQITEVAVFDSAYEALEKMRRTVLGAGRSRVVCDGWRLVDPADNVLVEPADLLDLG